MTHILTMANMGTPIMLAEAFHLLVGNFFIGIGEGLLLAWLFKLKPLRTMMWMIPANYFSMLIGSVVLSNPYALNLADWILGDAPLYHIRKVLIIATIASFLTTIFLECPFIVAAMEKSKPSFRRVLFASLIAQTASYLVLVSFYGLPSRLSLISIPTLTTAPDLMKTPSASVYYIDNRDNHIYQLPLDGSPRRKIEVKPEETIGRKLCLIPSPDGVTFDLCLTAYDKPKSLVIPSICKYSTNQFEGSMDPAGNNFYTGVNDYRSLDSRNWEARTGVWAIGMQATNSATHEEYFLSLQTPFVSWASSYLTILPGDQVIYQVGPQIVLLDLPTRRMQLLTLGRSPIVILPPTASTAPDTQKSP